MVEGVLKERGQARRDYGQAIRQGHRASIAEEERPGVFTLRVGNLMPGDVATVELTMVGVLPYSDGEVTFRFPLVVAPRYIPGVPLSGPSVGDGTAVDTNAVPDASRISPPVLLPGFPNPVRLSLDDRPVRVGAPTTCASACSRSGEKSRGPMRRLILQPGERLDRDFILRFRLGGDAVRTSLSLHPDAARERRGDLRPDDCAARSQGDKPARPAAQRCGPRARPLRQHGRLEDGGGPPGDRPHDRHPERLGPVSPFSHSTIGSRRRLWVSKGSV